MSKHDDHFETRAIHSGRDFVGETGAVTPPVWLTSTFEYGNPNGFDYTRSGNPNFRLLERTIAELESAEFATVFGSGVSAITALVSTLKSGDVVVAEENIYGCTFRLFAQVFAKFGVSIEYLDFTEDATFDKIADFKPAIVWIESPTNPNLKIIDIQRAADAAHAANAPLVVDNTFSSSYLQRPLELGADLSLISLTKYTNGHSDALVGAICTNDAEWQEKMIFAQKALGLQPSPMDCWLTMRGAKTEAIRMERHSSNALAFATFLENETDAVIVRYPFLESHPQYEIAKKQMSGGSGIVTTDLGMSLEKTQRFLNGLKFFPKAESLGGVESLCCHPASMTHASVPKDRREAVGITDSLVRFSIGIEHIDDLIRDVREGLSNS
ncbi:PLP-dependent aspartate aminotransferase family protein [Verrucomicrobiales bacterium]|nr:PLP-dependent aspartate aminotransferase family protein [Verrucomicrobiales bacterium]MDC0322905.1 PLP-dependent aspartate aminotransferase family protein [Verrucomicrobiales bacterium]